MSRTNIWLTLQRIQTATPQSPIAVFKSTDGYGFDTFFASTVLTQRRISWGDPAFIGCFHAGMPIGDIRDKLQKLVSHL